MLQVLKFALYVPTPPSSCRSEFLRVCRACQAGAGSKSPGPCRDRAWTNLGKDLSTPGWDAPNTIGVDISKARLDAHRLRTGEAAQFGNDAVGFKELIRWVGATDGVVYEATGRYHRDFEEALVKAGLPLACANPLRARRFAQSMGATRRRTRRTPRFWRGWALDLRPTATPSRTLRDLGDLAVAREGLVRDRVAALNRQKGQRVALLKQQCRRRLAQIERHLQAVDAEIARTLAGDEGLARRAESLASMLLRALRRRPSVCAALRR